MEAGWGDPHLFQGFGEDDVEANASVHQDVWEAIAPDDRIHHQGKLARVGDMVWVVVLLKLTMVSDHVRSLLEAGSVA